jgi:hypothetical protein
LLDHIDGRHPDLGDPVEHRAAADLVAAQVAGLTPAPTSAVCQVDSLDPAEQEAAVDFLTAFAGSQAWNQQSARPGLPHLAAFCAEDATRLFAAAEALC